MVWVYTRNGVAISKDEIYNLLVAELGHTEALFGLDIVLDDDRELAMRGITRTWVKKEVA